MSRTHFSNYDQETTERCAAGGAAAVSPVARHPQVIEALALLGERFADIAQDGPAAYAAFLASPGDLDDNARLRREAVATVRAFLFQPTEPTTASSASRNLSPK